MAVLAFAHTDSILVATFSAILEKLGYLSPVFGARFNLSKQQQRNLSPDVFPHLYIHNSNDLQIKERNFLFLQIFYVFYFDRDSGLKSLQLVWRSIPYAYISVDELITSYPGLQVSNYLESMHNFLRDITGEVTVHPEPRSLKHYCRTVVRNALSRNSMLFWGIDKIGLPPSILSYLKLEY
ncbi:hypothetical protein AVEN_128236-1 [Araneus ventricosus]|uniref:SOCS box domain-containing protein n=1 Tax=Araneus ventricosus TaxID=182803 RepID=A0A4Y1ZZX9_ARAVE|nr:hypothetical protein AVEN_128236-1 [Araneus ventricosus]